MPQPLRLAHFQAAVLRLPAIERLRADAMLAAQLRCLHACFRLLQNANDLLFRVAALLHPVLLTRARRWPLLSENSHSGWTNQEDAAHGIGNQEEENVPTEIGRRQGRRSISG